MAKHERPKTKTKLPQKEVQKRISICICCVVSALAMLTIGVLFYLDILPLLYLFIIVGVLLVLTLFCIYSQMRKKVRLAGRIVAGILCAVLLFVNFNLLKITSVLGSITDIGHTIETVAIAVLKEDPAQTLEDVKGYNMGICDTFDREHVDTAIEKWNKQLKTELKTTEYDGLLHLVEALYDKKIGAMIYNPTHNDMVNEDIEGFSDHIRIIDSVEIKVKAEESLEATDVDVTKEPFVIYVSGIDTYGSIKAKSRSDVNMLVYINPTTKQILLLTTSRDGYLDIPGVTTTLKDKLTHAGIYGVEKSIATLEQVYDTKVNYFVRINFTSLLKIVDALGGIDIYCPYTFTAIDGIRFQKGNNHFNGEQALAFARERHAFNDGDNQRGKNQQLVIKAMLNKMMSKSVLKGYSSILSTVSNNLQTNMSADKITDLVKMQLSDSSEWSVKSVAVDGKGASKCCYSYSATKPLYVCLLDQEKIANAKTEIQKIMNGEILDDTDIVSGDKAELSNTKNPTKGSGGSGNKNNSSNNTVTSQQPNSDVISSSSNESSSDTVTSTESEPEASSSDINISSDAQTSDPNTSSENADVSSDPMSSVPTVNDDDNEDKNDNSSSSDNADESDSE